jgi:gas vesicle protein
VVAYIRGLVHGTVLGTVIGLCIAPQQGRQTREQIQRVANAAQDGAQKVMEGVRQVAPAAEVAARQVGEVVSNVRGKVERRLHGDSEDGALLSVDGSVTART